MVLTRSFIVVDKHDRTAYMIRSDLVTGVLRVQPLRRRWRLWVCTNKVSTPFPFDTLYQSIIR